MIWLWLWVWLLSASSASAATYYIDYDTGADTNNGTSTGTPWKHAPGLTGCANNCNITPAAGDILYFKAGVTWPASTLPFQPNASGTVGNPITYIKHPSWGTGDYFILDGGGTAVRCIGSNGLDSRQYLTFDGFHCKNVATSTDWQNGVIRARDYPNLTLKNFKTENAGANMHVSINFNKVTIENCVILGQNATGSDGVITLEGPSLNIENTAMQGSAIRNCDVTLGAKEYGVKLYNCPSCVVEKNYLHGYTNAAGYAFAWRTSNGGTFRYNIVDASNVTSGTAFASWHGSGSFPDPTSGHKIYNNTFIGGGSGSGYLNTSPNYDGFQFYNNIFYDFAIGLDSEADFTATTNTFFSTPTLYNGAGARTLSGNVTTDPLLANVSVLPTGAALQSGSPARDVGTAFDSYHNGVNTDYTGTTVVPQNSTPDMGAYEFAVTTRRFGLSNGARMTGTWRMQ